MGRKTLISLLLLVGGTAAVAQNTSQEDVEIASPQPDAESFEGRLLQSHNAERATMQVPALRWSNELQKGAKDWAEHLAKLGAMQHAPTPNLDDPGENLWAGTKDRYSPEEMIGLFIAEKQYFKPGNFPEVSTTGNWRDVGHYTQIIWPTTEQVGCAVASNAHHEFLVCRYLPAGNWRKKPVGFPTLPEAQPDTTAKPETDPRPAS